MHAVLASPYPYHTVQLVLHLETHPESAIPMLRLLNETTCPSFLPMSAANVVAIPPLHRPGTDHPRYVSTQRPTVHHVIPQSYIAHRRPLLFKTTMSRD